MKKSKDGKGKDKTVDSSCITKFFVDQKISSRGLCEKLTIARYDKLKKEEPIVAKLNNLAIKRLVNPLKKRRLFSSKTT